MSDNNSGRGKNGPAGDSSGERREPVFSDFDDDEFEELDRDTDLASAYEDDELEEMEDLDDDDYTDLDPDEAEPGWRPAAGYGPGGEVADSRDEREQPPVPVSRRPGVEDEDDDDGYPEEDWEEEDYEVEEAYREEEEAYREEERGWPVGLIVVALVALGLLGAGGYGVIQQRATTQEEIRQLQAALATAASPAELAASRESLQAMEQTNAGLTARLEALELENRRLVDTVAGLESQLAAQQAPEPPAAAPEPEPATPAAAKPAAAGAGSGDWFVNFSSYSQRAAADTWVKKLKPSAGKAVVQPGSRNGKTFYRVRIVDLADRSQAEQVARQLQQAHGLSKLWVGMEK